MTNESDLKPFENGDILAAATILNNPDDDHAGDGRIIQYDSNLNVKGTLWTKNTTHLVQGLKFDKANNLWACLLYTSPSPRDRSVSRMPSSA